MLSYNEIKQRKYIVLDGAPYEVISSHVSRKQSQKPTNQTKLKNLITGQVIEKNFHSSESVDEADLETKDITYLYSKEDRRTGAMEYWFADAKNPKERFTLEETALGNTLNFITENSTVTARLFDDKIIGLDIPIKVTLEVAEAPPNVKGNTAQGGNKPVTMTTGLIVQTPLFIKEGDKLVINTDTGEYVERAS